ARRCTRWPTCSPSTRITWPRSRSSAQCCSSADGLRRRRARTGECCASTPVTRRRGRRSSGSAAAPSRRPADMAIEGSLRELGFQDVLQLLELARKTGVLTLTTERRDDDAEVHFDAGQIVFARRRKSQRRLGQQLIRSGKLTERE